MTTIADIRQKYPQYEDMTDAQLAKGFHEKYYSDIPYEEFSVKIGLVETPSQESSPTSARDIPMSETPWYGVPGKVVDETVGRVTDGIRDFAVDYAKEVAADPVDVLVKQPAKAVAGLPNALNEAQGYGQSAIGALATGDFDKAKNAAGEALGASGRALEGGIVAASAIPAVRSIASPLKRMADKALSGKPKLNLTRPQRQAQKKLYDAMRKDGVQNPAKALKDLRQSGVSDGKMVFESFGKNVRDLAVGIGADGGAGANKLVEALTKRQAQQGPYLQKKLKSIFKTDDFSNVRAELGNSFKKIGAPLYEKVRPLPMESTPELGNLLTRPGMDKVLKRANANAARKGDTLKSDTVGFYHNIKLAVDDMASTASAKNAARETAQSWRQISKELVQEIEKQAPDYKTARQFWAGAKADEEALRAGQSAFKPSVYSEDIQAQYVAMSDSEKAFFKAGAFREAKRKINAVKANYGDPSSRLNSVEVREKLGAFLSGDELKQTISLLDEIGDQTANFRLIDNSKGSPTQIRQAAQESLKPAAQRVAEKFNPADIAGAAISPKGAMARGAGRQTAKSIANLTKLPESTKAELADVLSQYPDAVKALPLDVRKSLGIVFPAPKPKDLTTLGLGVGVSNNF